MWAMYYEANALKRLFNVADFQPVVGTARDIKHSYNEFKSGNIADGMKYGATAAIGLAVFTAKLAAKELKSVVKLTKNTLKAEKCVSKTAQIASDGITLARDAGKISKLAGKAGRE